MKTILILTSGGGKVTSMTAGQAKGYSKGALKAMQAGKAMSAGGKKVIARELASRK